MNKSKKSTQSKYELELPKIEKNIKMPMRSFTSREIKKNFLKSMNVGDSFLVSNYGQAANYLDTARQIGIKLSCRTVTNGVRVWRIE